jgi:hypothetical protein
MIIMYCTAQDYMHINVHPTRQIVPAQEKHQCHSEFRNEHLSIQDSIVQPEPCSQNARTAVLCSRSLDQSATRCPLRRGGRIHFEAKGAKGANERTNERPWSKTLLVIV